MNQVVSYELHAVALLTLVSPMMPWVVRQRVWIELGSQRLVHLMNYEEYLLPLLPIHLMSYMNINTTTEQTQSCIQSEPNPCESISLYTDIVRSLCRLRSPTDRSLSVVAIAVFQISRFIFSSVRVVDPSIPTVVISGPARQLLLLINQFTSSGEYNKLHSLWILQAVIAAAEVVCCVKSMSTLLLDGYGSRDGNDCSGTMFITILNRLKTITSSTVIIPVESLNLLDDHGHVIIVPCKQVMLDMDNSGAVPLSELIPAATT